MGDKKQSKPNPRATGRRRRARADGSGAAATSGEVSTDNAGVAPAGDATAGRRTEEELRFFQALLEAANRHSEMQPLLTAFVAAIKDFTACEAVGLRVLDEEGNIPYRAYEGFPQEFYDLECPLSIARDRCMCIYVVTKAVDGGLPGCTPGGSFAVDSTTEFLRTAPERLKGTTRNVCNDFGYESVALAPIRRGERIAGLIHVVDHRKSRISPRALEVLERAGMQLGAAIERVQASQHLLQAHAELELRVEERTGELAELNEALKAEIKERKRAEEDLERANRALKALSASVLAVAREGDESGLLNEICRVVVGVGAYRLTWVGFARHDEGKTVTPVAQAGFEDGYLDAARITWADNERGRGPTGTAIRTGKPSIARNMLTDPSFAPWREQAVKRGYASSIALPLIAEQTTLGALNIYADSADAFDDEEVALLMQLADSLAHGIAARRAAVEHKRTDEARREAERELTEQRTLSMRSDRLRALGQMAAGIAHELNQPLVGVRGLAEHLVIGCDRGWDVTRDEIRDHMQTVVQQADRMTHIIRHVRTFAKEAGEPETSPIDVNDVVRSSIDMLGTQFEAHGLELACELAAAPPPVVANPFSLEEVLINLLLNARDAVEGDPASRTAPGGNRIALRTSVQGKGQTGTVRIEVIDRGPGIPKEVLDRVFDPFFTTKGPDKGTGLGLAISKSIVETFGGSLAIECGTGGGTTVVVSLPASAGKPE